MTTAEAAEPRTTFHELQQRRRARYDRAIERADAVGDDRRALHAWHMKQRQSRRMEDYKRRMEYWARFRRWLEQKLKKGDGEPVVDKRPSAEPMMQQLMTYALGVAGLNAAKARKAARRG